MKINWMLGIIIGGRRACLRYGQTSLMIRPSMSIRSSIAMNFSTQREPDKKATQTLKAAIFDDAINIPNALTMARIVATPGICWLITEEHYDIAIATFWVAGFFDWLDGHLARKWNQQSTLGSFLDPLADKIFVAGTVLTLTYSSLIPLPLGILVIGRDLVLVGGSFYIRAKTKPVDVGFFDMGDAAGVKTVEASTISKFNTLFQFGLVWFTMTNAAWGLPGDVLLPVVWGISGASTLASGLDYWMRGNQANIFLKKDKHST